MRRKQYDMNENFADLDAQIRQVESQYLQLVQTLLQSSGSTVDIQLSVPLSVALIQIANKADSLVTATEATKSLKVECEFIVKNSIDTLWDAVHNVIALCSSAYTDGIGTKELALEALVIIGAAFTLVCYGVIVPIILKVARQKREALGSFACISAADIENILSISKRVSIKNAKYHSRFSELREEDDDIVISGKKLPQDPKQTTTQGNQVPVTQDPMLATHELAPPDEAHPADQNAAELLNKLKMQHKRDHLRSGE